MCAEGEKFPLIFDICVIVNNKIRGKKNSIVIFNRGSIFIPRTAFVVLNDRGRRRGEDRKGWRKGRTLRWLRSVSVVRISGIHVLLLGDIRPPRNPVMHCAFTRGRDTLSHPLYFSPALTTLSPSFSRFLPRQIATITYTCQYITHPPPQPSFHRTKYSTFPDVSIPRLSLSFPLFPPRLEKNEGKVWGPDRYLYFSLIWNFILQSRRYESRKINSKEKSVYFRLFERNHESTTWK